MNNDPCARFHSTVPGQQVTAVIVLANVRDTDADEWDGCRVNHDKGTVISIGSFGVQITLQPTTSVAVGFTLRGPFPSMEKSDRASHGAGRMSPALPGCASASRQDHGSSAFSEVELRVRLVPLLLQPLAPARADGGRACVRSQRQGNCQRAIERHHDYPYLAHMQRAFATHWSFPSFCKPSYRPRVSTHRGSQIPPVQHGIST